MNMRAPIYLMVFLSYLLFTSCFPSGPQESITEEAEIDLAGTKWSLEDRYGITATIEFNRDLNLISGNDGCNSYEADLELKNFLMQFSKFTGTAKACDDLDRVDRDFLVALSKVRDYQVNKDRLTLLTLGSVFLGERNTSSLRFFIEE